VFAPVGVALTVAEDLPALIVKGRQRFETTSATPASSASSSSPMDNET
jgi:hypothetical protein